MINLRYGQLILDFLLSVSISLNFRFRKQPKNLVKDLATLALYA